MNEDVQGNLNVSRMLTVGADANINGNTTVGGNLIVGGYIIAPTSGDGEGGGTIDLRAVMSEISSLKISMVAAQTRIDALSTSMGVVQEHITNIYSQKETMSATMAQIGARVESLHGNITAMQSRVTELERKIEGLSSGDSGIMSYDRDVYKRIEGSSFDSGVVFYCADEKVFLRKVESGYEYMPGYNMPDTIVTDSEGQQHSEIRPRGDRIFRNGSHLYRYVAEGDIYEEI